MNEFTSGFWSVYITIITLASILACAALLWKLSTRRLAPGEKAGVMGALGLAARGVPGP